MATRWLDLVDPTPDEVLAALPVHVDPEVIEVLAAHPGHGREPRPLIEAHGAYIFGVLMAARPFPEEDRVSYLEIDLVATPDLLVTVRKTGRRNSVRRLRTASSGRAGCVDRRARIPTR